MSKKDDKTVKKDEKKDTKKEDKKKKKEEEEEEDEDWEDDDGDGETWEGQGVESNVSGLDIDEGWEDDNKDEKKKVQKKEKRDEKDEKLPGPAPALKRQKSFEVLTKSQIIKKQKALLDETAEVLGIPHTEAMVLLRSFKWNKPELLDGWFQNSAKVRQKAGLPATTPTAPTETQKSSKDDKDKKTEKKDEKKDDEDFDCPLCADTVKFSQTHTLSCNHRHCDSCWKNWLQAQIDEKGPGCLYANCMAFKCKQVIPSEFYATLLPRSAEKIDEWVVANFVQANPSLKFCPSANCDKIVEYSAGAGGSSKVTCACGYNFCFACGQEDHLPATCTVVKSWLLKCSSDSENVNWILSNTKICPACKVSIEKNQGCNHMTCRNCRHEFCWLCKGNWNGHNACNQYGGDAATEEAKSQDAGIALKRYVHYFNRYDNHHKSISFAEKTRKLAEKKMDKLQNISGSGLQGVQFLLQAVNSVIENRRLLQWTYAIGFYLKDGTEDKALFELHQQRLETFTEQLSQMTEQKLEKLMTAEIRTDMINLTRVVEKYRTNIIDFTTNNSTLNDVKLKE